MFGKIRKQLKPEDVLMATRDITFLSCSIFNEAYRIDFKKEFKKSFFKNIFWFQTGNQQIKLYRSIKENNKMAKTIGDKFIKDIKFAKKVINDLIKMSDEINDFIKANKKIKDLEKNWDYFFKLYKRFFVFHQVAYWPVEYLNNINKQAKLLDKIREVIELFDKAYKYNENIIPNVEKYFIKLGIRDKYFNELKDKVIKTKRSILLVDKKNKILGEKEATVLDKVLEKKYNDFLKNKKEIKGLVVYKGKVKGKVKLVKTFSDFKKCQSGDVVVTQMTRPQYNIFIKKAKAIVTDEGGLLCHASILARENKIPCIVGTKNATQILKDGDWVEVDATRGVVKILNKK